MTVELKRMYQRRGLEKDLPTSPQDGEIYVAIDTKNIYIGISGNLTKLMNLNDVIDNLNTQSNNPLSARQGFILQGRINSVEDLMVVFKNDVNTIVTNQDLKITNISNDVQNINNSVITLGNTKQDIVVIKDIIAPLDTEMLWFDKS